VEGGKQTAIFDASDFGVKIAAKVKNFDPLQYIY
jgi:hypothetical protein